MCLALKSALEFSLCWIKSIRMGYCCLPLDISRVKALLYFLEELHSGATANLSSVSMSFYKAKLWNGKKQNWIFAFLRMLFSPSNTSVTQRVIKFPVGAEQVRDVLCQCLYRADCAHIGKAGPLHQPWRERQPWAPLSWLCFTKPRRFPGGHSRLLLTL